MIFLDISWYLPLPRYILDICLLLDITLIFFDICLFLDTSLIFLDICFLLDKSLIFLYICRGIMNLLKHCEHHEQQQQSYVCMYVCIYVLYFIIKNYSKYVEIHMFRFSAHSVSIVNWWLKVPFVFCENQAKYFSHYHELIWCQTNITTNWYINQAKYFSHYHELLPFWHALRNMCYIIRIVGSSPTDFHSKNRFN